MKRFLRSTAGKAITFILCILSLCVAAVSVLGAVIMAKSDFYTQSEEQLEQTIINSEVEDQAQFLLRSYRNLVEQKESDPLQVPDQGNIVFHISDAKGKELVYSEHAQEDLEWEFAYRYDWEKEYVYSVTVNTEDASAADSVVLLEARLKEGLPETDSLMLSVRMLHLGYGLRYTVFVIGALSFLLLIACFIILMCTSARQPGSEKLSPGLLNRVPFDLLLVLSVAAAGLLTFLFLRITEITGTFGIDRGLGMILMLSLYAVILLGLCMSAAARLKQKNLLRNLGLYYILKGIGKLPMLWKTILVIVAVTCLDWLMMIIAGSRMRDYFFLSLAEKVVIIPIVLYVAWSMRRLQKSGEMLADGNLSYQTDTKGLFWDFRKHGENLNRISEGIATAVNKQMKSERMKTELITNVSHDIKTPLTSIINYAVLIGNEPCENEKIKEYAEVLVRQSDRLKRLIEDLVEASKASTGNLDVELVPCDANIFLSQAAGEYEDKLSAAQLELVVSDAVPDLRIMADGRRMWRIFDNLMNNICKYSLPGSRVYLSLERREQQAVFTFRNTSKNPLNITEEELMERFTRGDSSRNTEGNGLGLSIAKSLAQLQNGKLTILIDGDLFKAQLWFPEIR